MAKKKSEAPPEPSPIPPIDIAGTIKTVGQTASKLTDKQFDALVKNYPDMERQTFGTIGNIVTMLDGGGALYAWERSDPTKKEIRAAKKAGEPIPTAGWTKTKIGDAPKNEYTAESKAAIEAAMAQSANVSGLAGKSAALGDWGINKANDAYATAGPTEIERRLEQDALQDLSLGRALSAEELRNAAQSVRSAFAARGLGSSLGSATAEVLNRDAFANQRLMQRRGFAGTVNDMMTNNLLRRRGQAGEFAALGSNALGQASQAYGLASNIQMQGASNLAALDPTRFAIQPGMQMAGGMQGNSMSMIGNTFGNTANLAGNLAMANADIAGFNTNMQASMYNSYQNNQAALRAAGMYSGASDRAANLQFFGNLGSGTIQSAGFAY